ncbi:hypothetical protein ACFWFF_16190 [Streptomyces sp. NPDC060223]|uniref:hypothetical protein n=1 Tax=unclassified Streptomyces TaxID=2593676 RepID=UPI00362D24E1
MSVEPGPVLIRNEDPWQSLFENGGTRSGRRGHVRLRVWRAAPDQLTIVLADTYGQDDFFAELILMLRAEYPGDSIKFFFHHPGDWTAQLHYQPMTLDDEGEVVRGAELPPLTLENRLGPSLSETDRP